MTIDLIGASAGQYSDSNARLYHGYYVINTSGYSGGGSLTVIKVYGLRNYTLTARLNKSV